MPLSKSPFTWITLLTSAVAVLIPVLHLSQPRAAAASVISVALGHALTAWFSGTGRRSIPVITGAAGTILAALAAFGLHLSPDIIALVTAGIGAVLGHLVHQAQAVTPRTVRPRPVPAHAGSPAIHDS